MADNEKKPYTAPNGKHVVKLKVRFEQHNPGEVCGFEEKVARELTSKNYAEYYQPTDEEHDRNVKDAAELGVGGYGKPAAKAEPAVTSPKAPAK